MKGSVVIAFGDLKVGPTFGFRVCDPSVFFVLKLASA
jgi:hypothetical protein